MKIRFVQAISGHADERYALPDFSFAPGQEADVADDLAQAWIDSGVAAAVEAKPEAGKRK